MSTGGRTLPFDEALEIAGALVADLGPVTMRVKVVGSLRRRRPEVSDIEILAEPHVVIADLFGARGPDVAPIRAVAERWGRVVKGGERYIQVELPGGIRVDLFLAHEPANWFVLMAIRTGPAALGQWAVTRMHSYGMQCVNGRVIRKSDGTVVRITNEAGFFACAGLACLPPARRDSQDAYREVTPPPSAPVSA